jgi:imidazolonepropionase
MTRRDIQLLSQSNLAGNDRRQSSVESPAHYSPSATPAGVIPTALPGTSFFLNMPFAPARQMIEAGLPLATDSDYNPGSTPSGDMKFVVSLACIKMRLLPQEALNAGTLNAAAAMGLSHDYGSIGRGKVANFFITQPIRGIAFLPYAYTTPLIRQVFLQGKAVQQP